LIPRGVLIGDGVLPIPRNHINIHASFDVFRLMTRKNHAPL